MGVNPTLFDVSEVTGHKPYWTLQALTHVGRINGGFVFHCNGWAFSDNGPTWQSDCSLGSLGGEAARVAARMGEGVLAQSPSLASSLSQLLPALCLKAQYGFSSALNSDSLK